jgi:hypothetical protein
MGLFRDELSAAPISKTSVCMARDWLARRALRNDQVALDYPRAHLTIAKSGALQPEGQHIAAHFSPFDFIVVSANVGGKPYDFLLDWGAKYCLISQGRAGGRAKAVSALAACAWHIRANQCGARADGGVVPHAPH